VPRRLASQAAGGRVQSLSLSTARAASLLAVFVAEDDAKLTAPGEAK
jgi:hypothetical protein